MREDATPVTGFTAPQRALLRETLRKGAVPRCPVCAAVLTVSRVEPPGDVAYVRDRVWVRCPACRRAATLDRAPG